MRLIYGRAYGNSREIRCLHQQSFPQRHLPHRYTFVNIDRRPRETGKFQPVTANWGRPLSVQTPNLEKNILHHTKQDLANSTRRTAAVERVPHMTVWRVLHRQLLYPYHLQRIQGLGPADFPARGLLPMVVHQCALNPFFVSSVPFTAEAAFTRNGIINFHNNHE
jgi:hypothetical protein